MRLLDLDLPARLDPCERPRGPAGTPSRSCRRQSPRPTGASPAESATVSWSETRSRTVTTSCLPSSRSGPTTSERLIFAWAASRFTAPTVPAQESRRRERLGAHGRVEPERGERRHRLLAGRRRRRAGASWRASCAGGRMRPRRPVRMPAKSGGSGTCAGTRRARSRRSGGGRKTVRETGWKPVRVGGELDQHRDGAVRLRRRDGEEAVGDLALHHHAPQLDASAGRRGSPRRSGVATLYGRFATSFVGARLESWRDRAGARRPSGASRSASRRCRGGAARGGGRARRRERARTGRRGRASARRAPGRSRGRRRPRRARRAGR